MGSIYYEKTVAVNVLSTTSAVGYPATNAALESLSRPWRSTSTGANDLTLHFQAAGSVKALLVQDANFASCSVLKSADGAAFSSVGTLTTYADKLTARRRGIIVIDDNNVKAVRLSISSGTPTDGESFWRAKAYPFASASSVSGHFLTGARVDAIFPEVRSVLANEKVALASTGEAVLVLTIPALRQYNEDILEVVRRARAGTVAIDFQLVDYPEMVLPVRFVAGKQGEELAQYRITKQTIELREVT